VPEPRPVDAGDDPVIVGAGLAGCLLATLLARRGHRVTVYERRSDPRVTGAERGRSINLAISARGLAALEQVDLMDQCLRQALPMHGRMVHPIHGPASFRPYSADGQRAINSISRAALNNSLLDVAETTPGVELHFGHRLVDVDVDEARVTFATDDGVVARRATVILATDGSYSAARKTATFRPGFNFSQDYLEHGYKELTIAARHGDFALDPDALHIWPRGSSMMIALPNLDRSFTCTLFWPQAELAALQTADEIRSRFERDYPDAAELIPDLVDDYEHNPVGSLVTIRCWPWVHHGDKAALALVGDAAHAIVPFFGQGANCAMEDCIEIDRCLTEADGNWAAALARYERARRPHTDAIADMALENFIEMRDRVSSKLFQTRVAAEHALERRLGGRYVSRYELVSFTTMPYADIRSRVRRQNRAVVAVAAAATTAVALAAAAVRRR